MSWIIQSISLIRVSSSEVVFMNKREALENILLERFPNRNINSSKVTFEKLLSVISKQDYNLKEIGLSSAGGISNFISRLFPDKPKNSSKLCNWLLSTKGLKNCPCCDLVKPQDSFYTNSNRYGGLNPNCKKCHHTNLKDYFRASSSAYKAAKLERIPKWADLNIIEDFYSKCPEGYEIDHIIPLQGINVSGLHVIDNLQYLTISDNREKSNKF